MAATSECTRTSAAPNPTFAASSDDRGWLSCKRHNRLKSSTVGLCLLMIDNTTRVAISNSSLIALLICLQTFPNPATHGQPIDAHSFSGDLRSKGFRFDLWIQVILQQTSGSIMKYRGVKAKLQLDDFWILQILGPSEFENHFVVLTFIQFIFLSGM